MASNRVVIFPDFRTFVQSIFGVYPIRGIRFSRTSGHLRKPVRCRRCKIAVALSVDACKFGRFGGVGRCLIGLMLVLIFERVHFQPRMSARRNSHHIPCLVDVFLNNPSCKTHQICLQFGPNIHISSSFVDHFIAHQDFQY